MIYKPLGLQLNLASTTANSTAGNGALLRIVNIGPATNLHFGNGLNSNTEYASMVITNNEVVTIRKSTTDIIWCDSGTIFVTPVSFSG